MKIYKITYGYFLPVITIAISLPISSMNGDNSAHNKLNTKSMNETIFAEVAKNSNSQKAWEALSVLSGAASNSKKTKVIQELELSTEATPSADLRNGLRLIGHIINDKAGKKSIAILTPSQAQTIVAASNYLVAELKGSNAVLANEWLSIIWSIALPHNGTIQTIVSDNALTSIVEQRIKLLLSSEH